MGKLRLGHGNGHTTQGWDLAAGYAALGASDILSENGT
jgi:hypothetical protein